MYRSAVLIAVAAVGAHAQTPAPGDVVINEIMYDPPAAHGSASNEWIELYNRSTQAIDLSLLRLADATSTPVAVATTPTPLEAGAYAVLVRTAGEFTAAFPGVPFLAIAGFPALNNGGDRPRLLAGEVEIEAVPYAGAWGGTDRSLERRDPAGPSGFATNWGSTTAAGAGTPGAQNSIYAPDTDGPTIVDVEVAITADTLFAAFDQPLDAATVAADAFVLTGSGAPAITVAVLAGPTTVVIGLGARLAAGAYTLSAPGVLDLDGRSGTGPPYTFTADPDLTPPTIDDASALDALTLDVTFSETVDASAGEPARYSVSDGIGAPAAVEHPFDGDRRRARLALATPLTERTLYTLTVIGVRDLAGNATAGATATVFLGEADQPLPGDLVVNEIMFDPAGGSSGEYVEIANTSPRAFDLREIGLTDGPAAGAGAISSGAAIVAPGALLVVVANRDSFAVRFPDVPAVEARDFPSLNNTGDSAVLTFAGVAIDSVRFDPAWHRIELEDATGVALERRDAAGASNSALNWSSSLDESGGTPGRPNTQTAVPGPAPDDAGLAVSRSPFDPDAGEATSIAYTLRGEAGLVRVRIFDGAGREVREIEDGRLSGRTGSVPWDGRGSDGRPLRIGIYVVLLESVDVEAGTTEAHRAAVVVGRR